jgi:hypothetical protein
MQRPVFDPSRKRLNIFAPELCTKKALKNQGPNFGAEFLISAQTQLRGWLKPSLPALLLKAFIFESLR